MCWDRQLARVKPGALPVPRSRLNRAVLTCWYWARIVPAAALMLDKRLRMAQPLGNRAQ